MNFLKSLLASTEFAGEDENLIVKFDDYFSNKNKSYNHFALDEDDDINNLVSFVDTLRKFDNNLKAYVWTYGYESTDINGNKFIYANSVWLDTVLSISKIKLLVSENNIDPTDVDYVKNGYYGSKTWLALQSNDKNVQLIRLENEDKVNNMIDLNWD